MFFAVVVVVLPHHQLDTSTIANEPVAECVSHLNKIDFKQQLMGVLMLEREFVSISGVIVKLPNTQTTHDHAHECFNEIITYLRITGR